MRTRLEDTLPMPPSPLRARLAVRTLTLVGALALASCTDPQQGTLPPTGPALDIVPVASRDTATLVVGTTLQLSAELVNPRGHGFEHKKERYEWASSAPEVASVDGGGMVTAVAPGEAWVTVEHKGAADSVRVTVVLPAEARALWVNRFEWGATLGPVGGTAKIVEILDRAKAANFNIVYLQVRGEADAYYRSEIEPCTFRLCGTLGNGQPGWDPLEVAVREAHARGIQLHAWLNAFTAWSSPASGTAAYCARVVESAPGAPRHVLKEHPEWVVVSNTGVVGTCVNSTAVEYIYLSPGIPEVRTHLARVAADIARRYDVDGIHLDRIRYPGNTWSYDAPSLAAFRELTGRAPTSTADPAWQQFRRDQVTAAVRETRDSLAAVGRRVALSAAVWPIYQDLWRWNSSQGYSQYYQDPSGWTAAGYLDVAVPMLYPPTAASTNYNIKPVYCQFTDWACLVDDHLARIAPSGRHVYAGVGANRTPDELHRQIAAGRAKGVQGFSVYAWTAVSAPIPASGGATMLDLLAAGAFKEATRVPELAF
jgi:uncharacterized lipoprotein YddW (UPF0748 family)